MSMSVSNIPTPPIKRNALRDQFVLWGVLAFVIIGMVGAAAATGWQDTWNQIKGLSAAQICILLALSAANYLLRGLRWHAFVRRLGLPLRMGQNMRHFLGGFAMTITPGRLGELIRMRWIAREAHVPFERSAPLVLVDRAADLAAMALILAISLATSTRGIVGGVPVTILALGGAWVATRPKLLSFMATLGHKATGRGARLFAKIRRAARTLAIFSHGGTWGVAIVLGLFGWAAEGFAFYLLLAWMDADVTLSMAVAIFVFSALAGGLTGAPGGMGGAEAAMIALLSLEGVSFDIALAATAVIRLTTLWFAILIGVIVFPIAEKSSLKRVQDVE